MGVSLGHLTQPNMPDNPEIWKAAAMADHFEKIQKLPDPVVGCPNFRRIPGYKVYCCGQPTAEGFKNCLEKVCGTIYPKDGKIIWLNMRQEPNVYVNGEPICARPPNKIGEYAELGNVSRDSVKADELEFQKVVEGRAKENGGKLKYLTIAKEEKEVEVKDLKSLSEVIEGLKADFPGLVHMRVPVCNSAAPNEADFDIICNTLVGTSINTPIIVNDQVGLSRATTGCVIACLFKEFQINASFEGGDGEKLPGGKAASPGNQLKLGKTFVTFMEAQPELRGLIDQGKGNLQWERDIPAAALANLESLANSDFKANLGKIIHDDLPD